VRQFGVFAGRLVASIVVATIYGVIAWKAIELAFSRSINGLVALLIFVGAYELSDATLAWIFQRRHRDEEIEDEEE
jgi:Na+/H+ antiporter NhaC